MQEVWIQTKEQVQILTFKSPWANFLKFDNASLIPCGRNVKGD